MSSPVNERFGATLRRGRLAAGLTQEELAERSGISVRGIGDLERGRRGAPHLASVRLLAGALGLDDAGRTELLAAARPEFTAAHAPILVRSRMPIPTTPLFGRASTVADASAALRRPEVRLLTLTGPGGVGKTRLAIAVANMLRDAFPAGSAFVDLAAVREARLVPDAVIHALGLRDEGQETLAARLRAVLAERSFLLVLDNVEHVIDAAPFIAKLLASIPSLSVLVTSRLPLRLSAERLLPISPLALPADLPDVDRLAEHPAVALFIERAQAVQPDFALTAANASAVAGIVRRLDGLPLAIELAAARIRLFSPQSLQSRLTSLLAVLDGGVRDAPARQQTMRAAIAWSHDLLSVDEQALFRRLAVFDGGASMKAAEAVSRAWQPGASAQRTVEALIDHSLIESRLDPAGEPRLHMLETISEFAAERLDESGEAVIAQSAHAAFFRELAHEHREAGWVQGPPTLGPCFDVDLPNIRKALAWFDEMSDAESLQQISGDLRWFWSERGYVPEGRVWLERGLALSSETSVRVRARAMLALAQFVYFQGDEPRSRQLFGDGLTLYRESDDSLGQAFALSALGVLAISRGELDEADELEAQALALTTHNGDSALASSIAAATISNMGSIAYARRDVARAAELVEDALARNRKLGHLQGMLRSLQFSANIMRERGDDASALGRYQESLSLASAHDDRHAILALLEGIARIAAANNQFDTAIRLFAAAETLRERTGYRARDQVDPNAPELTLAVMREFFGEQAFALTWTAGRAAAPNLAIADALAVTLPERQVGP